MKRILILGGGIGGILTANAIARQLRKGEAEVTLLSLSGRHLFQPGLLHLPFGKATSRTLGKPLRKLLHNDVNLFIGHVDQLDTDNQRVSLADGAAYHYDYLVLATGSIPEPDLVPGLREDGYHFHTVEAALRLHATLQHFRGGRIVVGATSFLSKCPQSPIEFAFLLDEYLTHAGLRVVTEIVYLSPLVSVYPDDEISQLVEPLLADRGILTEMPFTMTEVHPLTGIANSAENSELDYDLLVMVPPHCGAPFLRGHSIATEHGWVITDPASLQVKGHSNIWSLGDAANLPMVKIGSATHFQAPVVAAHIVASLRDAIAEPAYAEYGGHAICFLETGHHKAIFFETDYERPPKPHKPHGPSMAAHYLKSASNKVSWHLVPGGVA